jgi:hypothetical protein
LPTVIPVSLLCFGFVAAERAFHLTAQVDHIAVAVEFHVVEADDAVLRDGSFEPDIVRESDQQPAKGKAPRRRNSLRPYGKAAFAVERLAGFKSCFAVATASPRNSLGVPIGSPWSVAERTRMLVSRPIMWNGLHIEPYQPEGSVRRPYWARQALAYSSRALGDENAVADVVENLTPEESRASSSQRNAVARWSVRAHCGDHKRCSDRTGAAAKGRRLQLIRSAT